MKHKTFMEAMAEEDEFIRLTYSQKRVLRKVQDAMDPEMAATQVIQSSDSRNLIAAVKTLARYGLVITTPYPLGFDDEPEEIKLTAKGEQAAERYDVQNDDRLITQDEKEDSAPQGEQPVSDNPKQAGSAADDLELSSFFIDINELSKLND